MDAWSNIYITDRSGKKFWSTTASPMSAASEIRNMKHRLEDAKKRPAGYAFLDLITAVIMVNGEPLVEMTAEELAKELEG